MKYYNEVIELLFEVIDEVNLQYKDEFELIKSEDTALFGRKGSLDSLGLVNFVVATEQLIEDSFDTQRPLTDERVISLQLYSMHEVIVSLNKKPI